MKFNLYEMESANCGLLRSETTTGELSWTTRLSSFVATLSFASFSARTVFSANSSEGWEIRSTSTTLWLDDTSSCSHGKTNIVTSARLRLKRASNLRQSAFLLRQLSLSMNLEELWSLSSKKEAHSDFNSFNSDSHFEVITVLNLKVSITNCTPEQKECYC